MQFLENYNPFINKFNTVRDTETGYEGGGEVMRRGGGKRRTRKRWIRRYKIFWRQQGHRDGNTAGMTRAGEEWR